MKKVLVIGSGFAGLSAAVNLTKKKYQVTILEASPKAGGRAYSYFDDNFKENLDNGQHILMGCYSETLNFLKIIGAEKKINYQKKLYVPLITNDKKLFPLKAKNYPYPFDLLSAINNLDLLTLPEKIKIVQFIANLIFCNVNKLKNISVEDWLKQNHQTEKIQSLIWSIISIGALNTNMRNASAYYFANILKKMFLNGSFNSTILLPITSLSELYCQPAIDFLHNHNAEIYFNKRATEFNFSENKRIVKVITSNQAFTDFDFVICAIPYFALKKIKGFEQLIDNKLLQLKSSSILTFHILLKENPLKEKFYGLINSPLHWVFNHHKYITTVISDANKYADNEREFLFNLLWNEIEKYLPLTKDMIIDFKMIKEKRATFIPDSDSIQSRPSTKTNISNLFLAGDWINTGLPATIESAVLSGKMASEEIIAQ